MPGCWFVSTTVAGKFVPVAQVIWLNDCIKGQQAPPELPFFGGDPRFMDENAASPNSAIATQIIWVRFFMFPKVNSLALAELAGLGDLLRAELHLVSQCLGDRNLSSCHCGTRIQPFL